MRELGERAFEDAGGLEEPPRPRMRLLEQADQRHRGSRVPSQRSRPERAEPVEQPGAGTGTRRDETSRVERDVDRFRAGGRRRKIDDVVVSREPTRRGHRVGHYVRNSTGANPLQSRAHQRRSDHRGDEHHEQERRIEVASEHALAQPDGGEDEPDLAARQHAQAHEPLVAGSPHHPERGDELAEHGDDDQETGDPEHLR